MQLADNIRRIRKSRGLTQAKLAHLAGVSSVAMVEKRGTAAIGTLEKIAKALGCTVSDLLREQPPKRRGV